MRDAQKMYFKYRTNERLQEALQLEKEIDQEILRVSLALSQKESEELFNKLNTAGTAEIKACGDMTGGYSGQPTKPRNL